jgi:hypothetical protein
MGILDGFYSLGKKINKSRNDTDETYEGVIDSVPELELSLSDEDLISLTKKWERRWEDSDVRKVWLDQAEENEKYWKGEQFGMTEADMKRPLVDNLIFESLETFLPQATRRNPEPTIEVKGGKDAQTPEATAFADMVEQKLTELADELKLRLKIKKAARHWAIYLLGVGKVGWDLDADRPTMKIIRPKKLILDPEGTIDEDGYTGEYVGETRSLPASILVKLAPKKASYIKELVKDQMGSRVSFKEWWTAEYMCWTLDNEVLLKRKNPHWNYDQQQDTTSVDDYGVETPQQVEQPGVNHFPTPRIPFIFLSIFNLGKQPVDETSLISQNLSSQDLINKRLKQIDRNADSMNNGMVVSLERSGLTQEQASQVANALKQGKTVVIPQGAPRDAVDRMAAPALPSDIFNQLQDTRFRLRDVFGTRGLQGAGLQQDQTVRGKVLTKGSDTDRIGGGVTEYLEQFADDVYNWFVQMLYVYNPEIKILQGSSQPLPQLLVSVKEGSLLPKDAQAEAQQAVELWSQKALDPITLFEKLEYPNPKEAAKKLFLWMTAPQMLFQDDPEIQQLVAMQAQQAQMQMQQQQQAEAQSSGQQHEQNMEGKLIEHQSKMEQMQAKGQSDQLLARTKIQK